MKKRLSARVLPMIAFIVLVLVLAAAVTSAQSRTLHFLAPGFSPELASLLKNEFLPEFESLYDVEVTIEPIGWGERTDRIAILLASGLPPDLIGTGYYSPYQEGASRLLAPLDKYLAGWEHTDTIPEPVWET